MNERPFQPSPIIERRYGEMRCRRYLFDRSFEADPASKATAPRATPSPPQKERADRAERPQ